jgi:biotin carboxyl carrier protein
MRIQVEYQSHIYNAEAQFIKGKLWVHFQGRTWCIEEAKKKFGKSSMGKESSGDIISPMPGKVTRILKNIGDPVSVGDVVLVMEAMKMEYTLKADIAGTLLDIFCKPGDQVILGKPLAKIESAVKNENG